jgi:cytochrome P450
MECSQQVPPTTRPFPIPRPDWFADCAQDKRTVCPYKTDTLFYPPQYVCHTNAKNYKLRMLPDAFRYVIKNKGITGSDGRYNREHRRMCQKPFMNSFSLEQFSGRVEERVGALLDAWETNCETNGGDALAVDIDDHSQKLTLDIVTSLAFNKDFKQVEGINASLNGGKAPDETIITKVLDAYNTTSQIMGELFITPVPILKLQNFLGIGRVRELKEGYKILEQNGVHIIEERRTQLAANAEKGDTQDYCLLDSLLRATDENGNPLPQVRRLVFHQIPASLFAHTTLTLYFYNRRMKSGAT